MSKRMAVDPADERLARVAWSRLAEPGDPIAVGLIDRMGPGEALRHVLEGSEAAHDRYRARAGQIDPRRAVQALHGSGGRIVIPSDPEWPPGLDALAAPPICLWVRGPADLAAACKRSVSIVGARASTEYGEYVTNEIAFGCSERGFTVVSGAAYGIDGTAHRAALRAGGLTIAVVAGGLDRPYPSGHDILLASIAASGAVISEMPPGSSPTRNRFIERNRTIATMTQGTVVVEAAARSGALSTARKAADHHRPVGAVPGPVTSPVSAGCHQALRDGYAIAVTNVDEVAELIGSFGSDVAARPIGRVDEDWDHLDPPARQILEALPRGRGSHVTKVAAIAGVTEPEARAALGRLALLGLAERHGAGWRRTPGR